MMKLFLLTFCVFGAFAEVKGSIVLIPVCAIIAAFKLGIEELGVQITEPFSILPVSPIHTSL